MSKSVEFKNNNNRSNKQRSLNMHIIVHVSLVSHAGKLSY